MFSIVSQNAIRKHLKTSQIYSKKMENHFLLFRTETVFKNNWGNMVNDSDACQLTRV